MIFCDMDNLSTWALDRPSPEAIAEEWRKQTEAVAAFRRRLRQVASPRAIASVKAAA